MNYRLNIGILMTCPGFCTGQQAFERKNSTLDSVQLIKLQNNKDIAIDKIDPIMKFLKSNKIFIRKTFDATSKDEEKPAAILWNHDYENGLSFFTIGLEGKSKDFQPFKHNKDLFLFAPKLEWHTDNTPAEDKGKNNIGGGLGFEFFPLAKSGLKLRPFLTGSFDYKNDMIKDLQTFSAKGYVSANGDPTFSPGAMIRLEDVNLF